MPKLKGYWCPVLHAHLPFVRHPEYQDFLEEDWFYEGLTETYIPLLSIFEKLAEDGIHFRLTMTISPTLAAMLSDPLLQSRYRNRLYKLLELSSKEIARTRGLAQKEFHQTAILWKDIISNTIRLWEKYRGNLLEGFRRLQDEGFIEIITCGATHGFLPFIIHPEALEAQIKFAVDDYTLKFRRPPRGIWLPECAYQPGEIDKILKKYGIKFFFMEAHGLLFGRPAPRYGVFAPVYTPDGLACFGRDQETAHQVWSADVGYPGDPEYREFYRDVGYDLDYDYIRPYLHEDGVRRNVGLKYYRITSRKTPLDAKKPYNPELARERARTHAGNFMFNREKQIEYLHSLIGRKPIVVSPFDAELFGHWWFEGPVFLDFLLRKINSEQNTFRTITPTEYLNEYPHNQIIQPAASSWGDKGYYEVWLNGSNDWIYRHLHKAAERMIEISSRYPATRGITKRALNQMARELVLAQSSDWAFIMTTGTMVEYARKRTTDHILRFTRLYNDVKSRSIDTGFLEDLEKKDNIFPAIDYSIYARRQNSI